MITVGSLCKINGKETEYWLSSYASVQYSTQYCGTWTITNNMLPSIATGPTYTVGVNGPSMMITNILGAYIEEYHKVQESTVVDPSGISITYTFQPMLNKIFMVNGAVGLVIWISMDGTARVLIEDKIYTIPFESLLELTEENVAA